MLDVFEWHRLYKCAFCICGFVSFSLVLWVSCDDGRLPFCHHHESTRCSPVPLERDAGWAAVDLSALGSCKCLSPKQDLLPVRTSLPWSPSPWVVTAFHPLSSSSSPKQGLQWRFTGDRNKAGEDAAEPLAATGTWRVAGNQEPGARAKANSVDTNLAWGQPSIPIWQVLGLTIPPEFFFCAIPFYDHTTFIIGKSQNML